MTATNKHNEAARLLARLQRLLRALGAAQCQEAEAARILEAVARVTGIPAGKITGKSRKRPVADARKIAAWQMLQAGHSLPQVGRALHMHHTSVMYSRDAYKDLVSTCPPFRALASASEAAVKASLARADEDVVVL